MRIPVRTSRLAKWARRAASLALPLVFISVFMHRAGLLESDAFTLILGIAGLLALIGVLLAVAAFARLWHTGDRGWARAIQAFFMSVFVLSPFFYAGFEASQYPAVSDVSTAPVQNLPLLYARNPFSQVLFGAEASVVFPNARTRSYPLAAAEVFKVIEGLVADRGWDIRFRRIPVDGNAVGEINAIATSWFGWRDEIVIVVSGPAQGSSVAVRSASFYSGHDLGTNGKRIEEFLLALDSGVSTALTEIYAASGVDASGTVGN